MSLNALLHKSVLGFRGPNPDDSNGAAGLSRYMGITSTSLSHKVSPTYPSTNLSPDELVLVMELTGDHSAFFSMAIRLGYAPIPLPSAENFSDSKFNAVVTENIKEFSESLSAATTAHQSPTRKNVDACRKEVLDSIRASLSVIATLETEGNSK